MRRSANSRRKVITPLSARAIKENHNVIANPSANTFCFCAPNGKIGGLPDHPPRNEQARDLKPKDGAGSIVGFGRQNALNLRHLASGHGSHSFHPRFLGNRNQDMILFPVRYFLKIAAMAGFCACMLHADVYTSDYYTYDYFGATFDTECDNFIGCYAVSGMGSLTGYATFSQPLGPNQTIDASSPVLLDWQLFGPPSLGGIGGLGFGSSTTLFTTGANGEINSWSLFNSNPPPCFGDICETAEMQSDSTNGDYVFNGIVIDQFYFESLASSTPGTWTPDFVLTPEPAATPLVKLLALLATIAAIAFTRRWRLTADRP